MKVLIIGYGSIGKRHKFILENNFGLSHIDIVTKRNLKTNKTFKSLEHVDSINSYDYFIISNETFKHYDTLVYLDKAVKNKIFLVEKPLFHKSLNFDKSIYNNKIFVAYNLRFHPLIKKLKNFVENNSSIFVDIITGQNLKQWRPERDYRETYSSFSNQGGGVLMDLSHELDYLIWIFGGIEILQSINTKISNLEINSDDFICAQGMLTNKTLFRFSMDYINEIPQRSIKVYSNDCTVFCDLIKRKMLIKREKEELIEINCDTAKNTSYISMHQSILENKFHNLCSLEEGMNLMNIIDEIKKDQYVYKRFR